MVVTAWLREGGDDDEVMEMMTMVLEVVAEWGSGLGRSEEEEHIWCSPEKSARKVFRRRLSGGRRWPEKVGEGESDG
ncbi:hypothetical protein Tco_0055657, partial [Tanacetum coccineum]